MKRRSIGIGLATLLAFAAMAPAAFAQKAPKVDAKMVAKGMADAPAVISANSIPCTLGNALYIGGSTDPKTKVKSDAYELACTGSLGLVVMASSAGPAQVFSCLQTSAPGPDGKPSNLACKLPENLDQTKALGPFLTKGGVTCDVQKARAIGSSPTASYFEAACADGKGYIISTSNAPSLDKEVVATTCLAFEAGGNLNCTLSDPKTALAVVDTLNTAAAKNCAIKDRRYILSAKDGSNFYEVACNDGKGYVYEEASNGSFKRSIDCAAADFVGGGCKLTDSRAAATEQNGLYTRLAKAAGYNCDVEKYGILQGPGGADTVELQCSNRPDGAIAMFGKDAASTKIYDCVQSEINGFRCSFTHYGPLLPKISADLKTVRPQTSCVAADARVIGATADEGFVEVSCTDGLAGFVLGYNKSDSKPKEALSCGQAKGIGGGCKLETNVNPKKG